MKSFKNHYNRNRYSSVVSLLKNSSFENLQINVNSFLYYNDFTQLQKDSMIWSGGGIVFNTSGGFALINGIADFTFPLPFPSGSQCIVLQSKSFIQQSLFLNSGSHTISFMYSSRSGLTINPISVSIDDVIISTTPNIAVVPWTLFSQSFNITVSKIVNIKLSGTISSVNQCTGIDNVIVN